MDFEKNEQKPAYVPRCPTCGCPDIRKLKSIENNFSMANEVGNGNFACKTFVCNNCGYAW